MQKKRQKSRQNRERRVQKKVDESVEIWGVSINGTHKARVLRKVALQRKNLLHIATVNSEFVMEARENPRFRLLLERVGLKIADSWGVVWASRILGLPELERISGGELVEEILARASARGEKVFLLGARKGVAESAAAAMKKKYPGVRYAWYEGAKTVQVEKREEASMAVAKINAFEPDYLLVAYGSPWQDFWIEENKPYLRVRVAIGVGGVVDEWAGEVRLCPRWLDRAGGKWAWRVVTQPWRWKRILRVFKFAALVLMQKLID